MTRAHGAPPATGQSGGIHDRPSHSGFGTTPEVAQAQAQAAAAAVQRQAGVHTFVLLDGDRNSHSYILTEHPPDEGLDIIGELMAVAGGPIGQLAHGVLGDMTTKGLSLSTMMDSDALAGVDWAGVGRDIAQAIKAIRLSKFAARLLYYTYRDGHHLRDPDVMRQAYRANYGEVFRALGKVMEINHFVPFSSTPTDEKPKTEA